MLTKQLFALFLIGLTFCATAQSVQDQRKQIDRQLQKVFKQDPRIPFLQLSEVNAILHNLEKYVAERKYPAEVRNFNFSKDFPYPLDLRISINKLNKMLKDRELEEVTGIRLSWFKALEVCMENIYKPLSRIRQAQNVANNAVYRDAVIELTKQLPQLQKLLTQKEKIPASELQTIKNRNIKYRRDAQQKQIRLLQQKKRTLQ